jgi:hypothetical protein
MRSPRFIRALLAALVAVLGLQMVTMGAASAAALTTVGFNVSRPQLGDTNVRYTWTFTTATTGTVATVTATVPSGTAGASLSVTDIYGIPSGGTVALSGTTVTYTLTTPTSVSSGVKVLIAVDGFTNTSTAGTYTSSIQTNTSVPAAIDGPTTSASITLSDNNTPASVVIARSTSFTNSATTQTLYVDPATATSMTAPLTLTVKSNGASGYALNVKATTMADSQSDTIAAVSTGVATGVATGSFTANRWGYTMTKTGVGTLQGALATAGNYVGYTTAGENAVVASGVATTDTITLTNQVKVDFTQDAGSYTSTVTYLVTPTY